VLRAGKPRTIDVTSGTRPSPEQLAANGAGGQSGPTPSPETQHAEHPSTLGLVLGPLDDEIRGHMGLPPSQHGAVVMDVKGTSDAADKGLKAGDIIIHAGDAEVASPADVVAAVARAKKDGRASILLGIHRDGVNRFVPVKIEN
jgi:serine protease Do